MGEVVSFYSRLYYCIAGYVVFKLKTKLHCETCIAALTDSNNSDILSLINLKTKGGLIVPSQDVVQVCLTCEKFFRRNVTFSESSLSKKSIHDITQSVLNALQDKECFKCLYKHMFDCEPASNHLVLLLKAIVEKFLQVRYFYAGKQYTARARQKQNKVSRQVNTKLVIFSGQ
jgi:hypothetical protein